jgi:hypothetical protein
VGKPPCRALRGGAVLIVDVAANDDAQALDVEEGVLELQWIESPFDQIDVAVKRPLALFEFEATAEAGVAIGREHAHHVAVYVVFAAGFQARECPGRSRSFCRRRMRPGFGRRSCRLLRRALGQEFDIVKAPDLALQPDNGGEFFELGELVNFDHASGFRPSGCLSSERRRNRLRHPAKICVSKCRGVSKAVS